MKIGLLGYGTVGKGFCSIIEKNFPEHEITAILVRNRRDDDLFVYDFADVLKKDVDVIVEALTGEYPAYDYCIKTLERSIPYISANKKMITKHLDLFEFADKNNTKLMVEASCGGGIPWFSNIRRIRLSDTILRIEGIMNGTSNYILSSVFNRNMSFTEALKKAQELGYAEADPSDDIKGYDTANKLCISILKAFDLKCSVDEIPCFGIDRLDEKDIAFARNNDMVIKLVGRAEYDDELNACVMPVFVRKNSSLGSADANFNLLEADSENLGKLELIGQGAGSFPTGFSLVQDLCALEEKEEYHEISDIKITNSRKVRYYLRTDMEEQYVEYMDKKISDDSFISRDCSLDELLEIHEEAEDELFIGEVCDD